MIWFTSDEHYDHSNIIKYCNRPFKTAEEMNEHLILMHNLAVKPGDLTIHLGDFTFHSNKDLVHKKFISRLNGSYIFIRGNHDYWLKSQSAPYMYLKALPLSTGKKQMVHASHYPMRAWFHGAWNLHGHTHNTLEPLPFQLDVGVDAQGYGPISFDALEHVFTSGN